MSEMIAISAVVGDRTYRIKINQADEEIIRKTLKTINDKIVEFKTQFAGKDMQDYIAMVLIWLATVQQHRMSESGDEELSKGLSALEKAIDKQLQDS